MDWFERDFDHPAYFDIYQDKEEDAAGEGGSGSPARPGQGQPGP